MHSFEIYLPIAEMPVNVLGILLLGAVGGFFSGMFGIGGGFLLTPFLIFIGVPPAVAVATSSNQTVAASFSGFLGHFRRKNVDIKMVVFLTIGGFLGSSGGVWLFAALKKIGQLDLAISVFYVLFLTTVGSLMALESIGHIRAKKKGIVPGKRKIPGWIKHGRLPFVVKFPVSELEISAALPVAVGFLAGTLVALLGVGGGFVMIPAMIYLFGMPTSLVIGTSLLQIVFTTANVTFLQATGTHSVDIVLAALLILGSVAGAQAGAQAALRLPAEKMRMWLALIVLSVALKLALDLLVAPANPYSIIEVN